MSRRKKKPAPPGILDTNICWSPFAFTPEGKLLINILATAIDDIVNGSKIEEKKAAIKWLFYEDSPMKQMCLYLTGIHEDTLEKLLIDKLGEDKFDALIKLGRLPLAEKSKRGRKRIEGVPRTKSGRIIKKRGAKNDTRRKPRRVGQNLLDNKNRT
jgi:hypothetical protein